MDKITFLKKTKQFLKPSKTRELYNAVLPRPHSMEFWLRNWRSWVQDRIPQKIRQVIGRGALLTPSIRAIPYVLQAKDDSRPKHSNVTLKFPPPFVKCD
ncbi:hypothetical protein AVEN_133918-1 [Araneus ventricosus]|uniref:Uncharacterized protein n=1 Tax=Araneus ventricosus TaxID=182803 RepID=A0A4Y2D5D3_ARAVE|nr:hypothetical protein AVEN_133918-1 [Araneus ventricosus]